jgi:hypothetical protein
MQYTAFMCMVNRLSNPFHILGRARGSQRMAARNLFQCPARHEFHRVKRLAVVFPDFMNGNYVYMVQSREGFCLAAEPGQLARSREPTRSEHLDGHKSVQPLLPRFEYDPHSSVANLFKQFVVPN